MFLDKQTKDFIQNKNLEGDWMNLVPIVFRINAFSKYYFKRRQYVEKSMRKISLSHTRNLPFVNLLHREFFVILFFVYLLRNIVKHINNSLLICDGMYF